MRTEDVQLLFLLKVYTQDYYQGLLEGVANVKNTILVISETTYICSSHYNYHGINYYIT